MSFSTSATRDDPRPTLVGIVAWRVETLLAAGYSRAQAADLAATVSVDLHLAVDLVKAGCPHETAFRILL